MNVAEFAVAALVLVALMVSRRVPPHLRRLASWIVIGATLVVVTSPFLWLLAAAFKERSAFAEHVFFPPLSRWPETMTLDNFRVLFAGDTSAQGAVPFWRYVVNSLFVTSASTVVQLVTSALGGYALAVFRFRGRALMLALVVGSFLVPGMLLVAPLYEMSVDLGLIDTYTGLLLPGAVSTYGMFLYRQAFLGVPAELIEAGRVDGCGELQIFWKLVLPLVRPVSAAFCLVAFLGSWNAYLGPNVLLHSQHKLTMPIVLSLYVAQHYNQFGVFLAGTLLAILPPALLFFVLQREFVQGLTSGAVKG